MSRFITGCAMRWSDMDAYGHINNTAYLTYLEQARVAMLLDRRDGEPPGVGGAIIVAHNEISYLRPVVYRPEPVRLELWVTDIRGASFRVRYQLFDGETLAAKASTELVAFDPGRDRPRRLTEAEREWLEGFDDNMTPPADPPALGRDRAALPT
jgi:acyl-CoA thioester hydrolase